MNDQGGSRMDVTEDVAATLRAENHGHPPCVMGAAGFCTEHSAKARGIGYEEETSPTLRAGTVPAAVYENHSQDTRYTGPLETAPTVMSTYGTGGNNQPFVVETPKTLKIRSGCEGGGKGCGSPVETSAKQKHRPSRQARPLIQDNKSATLGCNNDQALFVPFVKGTRPHSSDEGQQWKASDVANTLNTYDVGEARCNDLAVKVYGICSKDSNAMKSENPKSGFYEAETSRCLDANGGNPTCNQGGMAVVALQGSMIGRADKNGPQGSGVNEDVSFTLDAADRHAVAYCMTTGTYTQTLNWSINTSCFTSKIKCPICGKSYRRSGKRQRKNPDETYYIWICRTKSEKGAKYCSAKSIPEKVLKAVCAEVLGTDEFDDAVFSERVEQINVVGDDTLEFYFYDGSVLKKKWKSTAKSDWWTDERRAAWGELHKHKATNPNRHRFYEFTGLIKCGQCGENFRCQSSARKDGTRIRSWHCGRTCGNINIRDEILKSMVCDVLGLDDFSEESMDAALEKITVNGPSVSFHLRNGSIVEREYTKPKRKGTKHTEEFKAHMRQIMKAKWKEGKMHGTKKSDNHSGYDQPVHGSAD